uniref:Uncharacterized protein n=1 Tax=Haptolina ericina TaxID=156174 RepID=A0A7S3EZH6_9EUKA|mmetsp:Transcript_39846/g.90381  ORF Transcript_39846/g.90381 Transcript_39846/m.90381 type:complete len:132 (+) Transcript_39846:194-589(+)
MKSVRRSLPVACETVQSVPASSVAVGRQALLFTAFGSQDRQDDVDDDPPVDEDFVLRTLGTAELCGERQWHSHLSLYEPIGITPITVMMSVDSSARQGSEGARGHLHTLSHSMPPQHGPPQCSHLGCTSVP